MQGKTQTVHLLAKELDMQVVEWTNPVHSSFKSIGPFLHQSFLFLILSDEDSIPTVSRMQQFREFMRNATRYICWIQFNSLWIRFEDVTTTQQRVVIVEDSPFLFDATQRQHFLDAIRDSSASASFPLVIILNTDTYSSIYPKLTSSPTLGHLIKSIRYYQDSLYLLQLQPYI